MTSLKPIRREYRCYAVRGERCGKRVKRRPWRDRFWEKVSLPDSADPELCWLWVGAITTGYGVIGVDGRKQYAHRLSYRDAKGEIPPGLEIDHLCRNTSCVRPAHLEAVTHRENVSRGKGPGAEHGRRTHCSRGHLLGGDNIVSPSDVRGFRNCKACVAKRSRDYSKKYPERLRECDRRRRSRERAARGNQ